MDGQYGPTHEMAWEIEKISQKNFCELWKLSGS